MRTRAAQVEPRNRCAVPRPGGNRTEGEHLVWKDYPVKDVPSSQAVLPLHVQRRDPAHRDDRPPDVRRVRLEDVEDSLSERLGLGVPRTSRELIRGELRGDCERVHPPRRDAIVVRGLKDELEERLPRWNATTRIIVRVFEVVHGGRDVDDRPMMRLDVGPWNRLEVRQLPQGEVEFERGRLESDSRDGVDEFGRKMIRADKA